MNASITAFLLLLVNNLDKLEHLTAEIDSEFGNNEDITFRALQELPYLNAVIWEGLRLMSPTAGKS